MHIFVCEGLWEKATGLEGGLGALEGSSFWPPDSLPCREGWSHGVGQKMGGSRAQDQGRDPAYQR